MESLERHIPLEGCFNFRDLGGYRTRDGRTVHWRRLFRSSAIHLMTENDVLVARDKLGIVTIIDLLSPLATARAGVGSLAKHPVSYHHIPLVDDDYLAQWLERQKVSLNLAEGYLEALKVPSFERGIATALRVIAEPGACPAVFHCNAGKDRTGTLAALILGLLGIVNEDIIEDYALTAKYMEHTLAQARVDPERAKDMERWPHLYETRPETMETLLGFIRQEYGSIQGYMLSIGVEESVLHRLKDTLLV